MFDLMLIAKCSVSGVHPRTTEAIINAESGANQVVIQINIKSGGRAPKVTLNRMETQLLKWTNQIIVGQATKWSLSKNDLVGSFVNSRNMLLKNKDVSIRLTKYFVSAGYSVDMGLMQINNRNLKSKSNPQGYNYSIEEMFDPCKNIKVGSDILKKNYDRAEKQMGPGQIALQAALSAYNTGNFTDGHDNGYVSRYYQEPVRKRRAKVRLPSSDTGVSLTKTKGYRDE